MPIPYKGHSLVFRVIIKASRETITLGVFLFCNRRKYYF